MRDVTIEKGYQKNAWMILAVLGILGLFIGGAEILGLPFDQQAVVNQVGQSVSSFSISNPKAVSLLVAEERFAGIVELVASVFITAVAYIPFRRNEKWAWYVMLSLPVGAVLLTAEDYVIGGALWPLYIVGFVLPSLAGLVLPYRRFFPQTRMKS